MDIGRFRLSVQKHEGLKLKAYQDSEKVWTIGYGTNLQTLCIEEELANRFLDRGLQNAIVSAKMFPEWIYLDTDARQNAFTEMVYNMGPYRVAGFQDMLAAIKNSDWAAVEKAGLDSRWAKQVGQRAVTLMTMMRTGQFQE